MQTHLTDDDLVLHYYGELSGADESHASEHLAGCAACHDSFRRLQRVLATVGETSVAGPELPIHFERTVWARLEPNLRRDRRWLAWLTFSPGQLVWAAAVLVLVTGAFFAGRLSPSGPADGPPAVASSATELRDRILLIDLSDHLDRSQVVLLELATGGEGDRIDISGERSRAEQLLAANRLYRQTASAVGDAGIVQFLDDLELLLVDLTAAPEKVSAADLREVRRRIESKELLFKIRVLSSEVRERQRAAVATPSGVRSSM